MRHVTGSEAHAARPRNSHRAVMMGDAILIGVFTLLSGLGDAQGFIHAGRIWQNEHWVSLEALKSAAGFLFGMVMYWLALSRLGQHGVVAVEVQTLFWFAATLVGVALLSGKVLRWPAIDQVVAVGVLAGVGWLMYRGAR